MNKKLELFTGYKPGEIFQALDIKFAFVNKIEEDTYKQVHLAIKCRDFLGDCIWSKLTGNKASIYGFTYNYEEAPYDDDKLRLSLKFPSKEDYDFFVANFHKLHEIEETANTEKSVWYPTAEENTIILESNTVWQSAMWKISLFTYFLKVISYENEDNLGKPESNYTKKLTTEIKNKLLSKIVPVNYVYLADNIGIAHNNSGFISVITGQAAEMNKVLLGDNS